MDWYPLYNSLRIAAISCFLVFFTGIFAAYYVARLPRWIKGVLDVVLTLPMVLPPTVVGYFILLLFGVKRPLGMFLSQFGIKFVMTWYGGILAGAVLAFARALGEYGATSMLIGYTPGRTATISTTVYQLWRTNDEGGAFFWVMVNLAISAVVLLTVNMLERRQKGGRAHASRG